jgi:hypothetical protein
MLAPESRNISPATQKHGKQRAHNGKQRNGELFPRQLFQIEQKRPGKEQQGQHSVQDDASKVDLLRQINGPGVHSGGQAASPGQSQRNQHGQQHGPDRDGQFEPANADPAEQGGGGEQNAENLQSGHGGQPKKRLPP